MKKPGFDQNTEPRTQLDQWMQGPSMRAVWKESFFSPVGIWWQAGLVGGGSSLLAAINAIASGSVALADLGLCNWIEYVVCFIFGFLGGFFLRRWGVVALLVCGWILGKITVHVLGWLMFLIGFSFI